jgi:hypothetical protein
VDPLDAVAAERGRPQVTTQVPGGLRELVVGEAAAGLDHRHPVALLREPQRRDAAAEPGADHHHVVIHELEASSPRRR